MITSSKIQLANYSDWNPQKYLAEYYTGIHPDVQTTIEFLVQMFHFMPPSPLMLEFGCGPSLSYIFPAISKVQEIHLAEYLADNRAEVQKWIEGRNDAYDWQEFTLATLKMEGNPEPTATEVKVREQQARERITQILPCNVLKANPLGIKKRGFYPLVVSNYCIEAVSTSIEQWQVYMGNVMSLVKPGGTLILSACGGAVDSFYRVGESKFPCTNINGQDFLTSLSDNGFTDIDLRIRHVPYHSEQGFNSIICARAVKGIY